MAVTRREEPIPALSSGLSQLVLAGLLLIAALPAVRPSRHALPARDVVVQPAPGASRAPAPAAIVEPTATDKWSIADIMHARERCMHQLAGTQADVDMIEPIKKGECGTAAPVRLKSVGSEPKVVFDPPVEINCQMVSALAAWTKSTLQPLARERLKSPVVRIVGGSGYSCRNIYNLPNARLSQHALANAIDIGGFALENGRALGVLKGWGSTARDIEAQAKAKAVADAKAKAARAKGDGKAKDDDAAGDNKAAGTGKPDKEVVKASLTSVEQKALTGQGKPVELGGPQKPTKEAFFLRALHDGACRQFGTVLGPEANDAHRNHFHLDLMPRRGRSTCE
jgi:hypothetical protein